MIGAYSDYARQFLLVFGVVTTVVFAVPLFLTPIAWGRVLRFEIPSDTDLAVYFGRCLGAFALVLEGVIFRAAFAGVALRFAFEILVPVCVFMIVIHGYGAVKRIQPITETVEIALWVVFLILGLAFFPVSASS